MAKSVSKVMPLIDPTILEAAKTGSERPAVNLAEENDILRREIVSLNKNISLLSRDLEHISYMCSTVNYYLDPGRDLLLDGEELKNIIHFIGIIVCESDYYGCE
jgi:hypothetical protein